MANDPPALGIGIIGLGGAAVAMIPKMAFNPRFRVAAAADLDPEIRSRFAQDFPGAAVYDGAEALCEDPNVELVYIATPNHLHTAHCEMAMARGKHVLIEKPMTIDVAEGVALAESADRNGVLLGVNVKHSFEPRVLRVREMARTGEFGALRMLHHWRYQDWLYRPRSREELTPGPGGGILWRQGPHQFDIIRTIGGGMVRSVRGTAAAWDSSRRVPGAHAAYLEFESGAFATAVYSGLDHWDSRELVYGVGRGGVFPDPAKHAAARRELAAAANPDWEEEAPAPSATGWAAPTPSGPKRAPRARAGSSAARSSRVSTAPTSASRPRASSSTATRSAKRFRSSRWRMGATGASTPSTTPFRRGARFPPTPDGATPRSNSCSPSKPPAPSAAKYS